MEQRLIHFTQQFTLWSSDRFLKDYTAFRRRAGAITGEDQAVGEPMFMFEELLRAVRRELGQSNKALTRGDLLALFINDIDDYLGTSPQN